MYEISTQASPSAKRRAAALNTHVRGKREHSASCVSKNSVNHLSALNNQSDMRRGAPRVTDRPINMTNVPARDTGSEAARARDMLNFELRQLTDGAIWRDTGDRRLMSMPCPLSHEPNFHCQFCVDPVNQPRTTCWHPKTEDSNGHPQCPCSSHDARVPWPLAPDGFRQTVNLTGVDVAELDDAWEETDGLLSAGDGWLIAHGPLDKQKGFTWRRDPPSHEFTRQFPQQAQLFLRVIATGKPNYQEAKIPLQHGLNIVNWRELLADYHDLRLCDYLEFGFPLGYIADVPPQQNFRNHASSLNYESHVNKYLEKEVALKSLIGPFTDPPTPNVHMNPLMSRPKKASEDRRVILDLSYAPNNISVNAGIYKCALEGQFIRTSLPTPQHLANELLKMG